MLLQRNSLQYINSVTHAGKVVLFGTDTNGKIWYSIKQDGFEDSYLNTPPEERTGWEDWQELELPNETEDDASVVEKETQELTYQNNTSQFILRSGYRTQDQTAVAPVQLVSGMEHLYVFRQSKKKTLLCDRYVLDGIANKLVRKLQVRFKRSGQRFKPSQEMQQTVGGLKNVDSLDYRDANGKPFYEPTTELSFIKNLHKGWFSVLQLPTVEHAQHRWHIFAYNSQSKKIDLYSLRVSQEGLFEVHDYTIFEPKSEEDPTLIPRSIPGLIKRTLDLNVKVGNGISATKFYVQSSQETEAGTQLMRDATRVMLAIVTEDDKVATINFAALGDGTLSQISDSGNTQILRSNIREVLLPLNTLDQIQTIGLAPPPPEGKIAAFNRTITDGIPHVKVTSAEAAVLKNGQEISIEGTSAYNGYYNITKIDDTTFEIDAPWVENGSGNHNELGIWKAVPPEEQAVIFDGIITGYKMTAEGKLRVTAENHGLENGDAVQIFDTASYDGTYPISKVDEKDFIINNLRWQTSEAVNLKIQSQKRRGIVFDGIGDYLEFKNYTLPSQSYTFEIWLKPNSKTTCNHLFYHPNILAYLYNNTLVVLQINQEEKITEILQNELTFETDTWFHLAIFYDYSSQTIKVYKNGELKCYKSQFRNYGSPDSEASFLLASLGGMYKGEMSDFRIWKTARTKEEIKNSMYLQLTGKELDLVGYWRLGGIAVDEDNQRKVIDFSVNQNDGIVHGDCYVSSVTLKRKLGDGVTDAVKYSNNQLFAVTQQATYEETFEFQVSPVIDPNNVNGGKIFNCTYWGKKTHRSKNIISFDGEITEIKSASESGWYVASCRFTVPAEVNLVRCLEISDVAGSWDTLEVRKHHIRKISDVITEASYTDTVNLSPLGSPQGEAFSQLVQLQQKELEEQTYLKKKVELEAELAEINAAPDKQTAINNKQKEINHKKSLISSLENQVSSQYTAYQKEQNNLFNYWCKISSRYDDKNSMYLNAGVNGDNNGKPYRVQSNHSKNGGGFQNWNIQYFKFEKVGDYYTIICKYENRIIEYSADPNTWELFGVTNHDKTDRQLWKFIPIPENYYKIQCKWGAYLDWYYWDTILGNPEYNGKWQQQWKIEKIGSGIPSNNNIANARQAWETKKRELQEAKSQLVRLQQELVTLQNSSSDLTLLKNQLTSDIASLAELIKTAQQQINSANSQIMATARTKSEAQTMPEIASQGDLATTGAILDFIDTASRVTALETVEGMVQLSYFDRQGKLRQGIFDATADEVNSYFEQWLPDRPPICLNCDSGNQQISLSEEGIAITGNWTIEANFVYPLPDTDQWNTLTQKSSGDRHIVVKNGQYLGTDVDGIFYYCLLNSELTNEQENAYDLTQLSPGWHHIAVVGKSITEAQTVAQAITSKTIFYIDGKQVGECLAKSNSNIQYIGNISAGGEAFGKISEVRIWNLALKETEILANSQVYLTGNEPGLVAYYRLNEGSENQAKDNSGNGNNGTITGANWWGNTKVVANPISQVMTFDGNEDYIALPPTNLGGSITIEAWVYNQDVKRNYHRLIDFGNGAASDNVIVVWRGTAGKMALYGFSANQSKFIETTEVFPNKKWVHVAATIDNNGNAAIYWNGVLKASGTVNVPRNISRKNQFIGKSNWSNNDYFQGKMADLRVWSIVRTQAEIKANMNHRLTGGETNLEIYLPFNQTYAEGSVTKVFDLANSHHGTVYNATLTTATPQVVKNSAQVTTEPELKVTNFDGTDDSIEFVQGLSSVENAITIEFWSKGASHLPKMTTLIEACNSQNKRVLNIHLPWGNGNIYWDAGNQVNFDRINKLAQPNEYKDSWSHWAFVKDCSTGQMLIYHNGEIWHQDTGKTQTLSDMKKFVIGSYVDKNYKWSGSLAEFRIWNTARSQAEIKANSHKRLTGNEAGLTVYLPLDNIESSQVVDLASNLQGTVAGNPSSANDSSFPVTPEVPLGGFGIDALPLNQGTSTVGSDSLVTSVEYNTYDVDPISKQKSAMMRRMFAYPTANGVQVFTDKRIESLELIWIGNAQFKPTLLGYIEGAPPVPSENMCQDGDYGYNGATSVQLTTTEDVEYSWNRSQDAGLGGSADVFLGVDSQTFGGIGIATEIESTKAGFKGTLDMSYQWFNESNVSSSSALVTTDSLELRGAPEVTPKFPHYGNRFIPKNVGYALVVSGLADVFISRLSRTQKMVGQEVRPVEDIPPDVNTITFLMNPAYVMNGSLDGLVGSSAANDEFYANVPQMRDQYGSLYPASYFRLMEAYNLKQQIEKADKERQSYFENFNSNLVDETSLNRQAGDGTPIKAVTLNEGAETIDASGGELTTEEKQAQVDQLQAEGGAKLDDLQKQGQKRKQEINSRIDDIEQRTHALESFAGWQKNMENILVRSGKRNIVNTYVWDADGGLRVEEQSFANTSEHTIGGSFTMSAGVGYEGDISIFKVSGGLTAMATTNLTQTMTKTQANSKGMELNVDLSGIEILGITDENDFPFQPGEKVDRFRMMSFYLENSTDNYLDFFKYVVDPEWLASNDEEARALRQVQSGRPNKTWRVLHRVTYVERPSLMGFGRDMRSLAEIASYSQARSAWLIPANATVLDEVKAVRSRVEYLENENAKLQNKIDKILDWINSQQP